MTGQANAIADNNDPLATYIGLAGDSINDGYLHLTEIASLRTKAKLVVLSACETTTGPLFGGEGPMGLARAFRDGGAMTRALESRK